MSTMSKPRRLKARRVDEQELLFAAQWEAQRTGKPVIYCTHGGGVPNAYSWPAETEAVVVVAWPDGRYWMSPIVRLRANGVTLRGAAASATQSGPAAVLFDGRSSEATKAKAYERFLSEIPNLEGTHHNSGLRPAGN